MKTKMAVLGSQTVRGLSDACVGHFNIEAKGAKSVTYGTACCWLASCMRVRLTCRGCRMRLPARGACA